ncbi:hypothetical protein RFI_15836 [Reticulomyxa filosa]|uniref:Uncharacterized protein n=1 Tax=Reticulomyxa filosa TaxID=46433 RepID=X6N6L8_RETFI|nr:hypothetical protein RFI_15836 [Reticulomyxa filosa]|eukprot:ETO21369.1 hypothetical protein RFI_15836 [Reticulomyxa filosa]
MFDLASLKIKIKCFLLVQKNKELSELCFLTSWLERSRDFSKVTNEEVGTVSDDQMVNFKERKAKQSVGSRNGGWREREMECENENENDKQMLEMKDAMPNEDEPYEPTQIKYSCGDHVILIVEEYIQWVNNFKSVIVNSIYNKNVAVFEKHLKQIMDLAKVNNGIVPSSVVSVYKNNLDTSDSKTEMNTSQLRNWHICILKPLIGTPCDDHLSTSVINNNSGFQNSSRHQARHRSRQQRDETKTDEMTTHIVVHDICSGNGISALSNYLLCPLRYERSHKHASLVGVSNLIGCSFVQMYRGGVATLKKRIGLVTNIRPCNMLFKKSMYQSIEVLWLKKYKDDKYYIDICSGGQNHRFISPWQIDDVIHDKDPLYYDIMGGEDLLTQISYYRDNDDNYSQTHGHSNSSQLLIDRIQNDFV